jgi:hypothetical protein
MSKKRKSKYGPRLKIVGQFIPHPVALIRILRGLSPTARRILDTLELEHCSHGGRDNGRLRYTYTQFEAAGIHRNSINPGLCELEDAGIVKAKRGKRAYADMRFPSIYTLTHLPTCQGEQWIDPTNDWKRKASTESDTGASTESATTNHRKPVRNPPPQRHKASTESDTAIYNLGWTGGGLRDGVSTSSPTEQPSLSPREEAWVPPPTFPSLTACSSMVVPFPRRAS